MDIPLLSLLNFGFIDMMKFYFYILFIFSLFTFGCKEVYTPETDNATKVLVVDGLISNEEKAYSIRLSAAVRFDSTGYLPEEGALVFVTDNLKNRYDFAYQGSGIYNSDPSKFKPQIGVKYTLNIETKDKKIYKSSEQELLSNEFVIDISNTAMVKPFYLTVDGEFRSVNVKGSEFIASVKLQSSSNPYVRFSNSVFLEYTKKYSFMHDTIYYCWKKYYPNEFFNINENHYNNSGEFNLDLGFYPVDTVFYSIIKERVYLDNSQPAKFYDIFNTIFQMVVSYKQYHLNEDVFHYYQSLNKQLQSKQSILDPAIYQIAGNITCISDPTEKAFGLFEASSISTRTYIIDRNLKTSSYKLKKIVLDVDSIPETGITMNEPPLFWVY
jgi:hypothetical protein